MALVGGVVFTACIFYSLVNILEILNNRDRTIRKQPSQLPPIFLQFILDHGVSFFLMSHFVHEAGQILMLL
jgi:hypothetical protein